MDRMTSRSNSVAGSSPPSPRSTTPIQQTDRLESRRSSANNSDAGSSSGRLPVLKVPLPSSSRKLSRHDRPRSYASFTSSSSRSSSVYRNNSSALNTTTRRQTTQRASDFQPHVVVRDEAGKDVTPVSLLTLRPTVLRQHTALADMTQSKGGAESPRSPSAASNADLFSDARSSISISKSFIGSESTKSGDSSPRSFKNDYNEFDDSTSAGGSAPVSPRMTPMLDGKVSGLRTRSSSSTDLRLEFAQVISMETPTAELGYGGLPGLQPRQKEEDMNVDISFNLEETPTIWLLEIPGVCIEKDTPEAAEVAKRNAKYEELKKKKIGNENYVSRGMQTINNAPKIKETQIALPASKDMSTMATIWDIYDSGQESTKSQKTTKSTSTSTTSTSTGTGTDSSSDTSSSMDGVVGGGSSKTYDPQKYAEYDQEPGSWVDIDQIDLDTNLRLKTVDAKQVFSTPSLKETLKSFERMIVQNLHTDKILQFRGLDGLQYARSQDTMYYSNSVLLVVDETAMTKPSTVGAASLAATLATKPTSAGPGTGPGSTPSPQPTQNNVARASTPAPAKPQLQLLWKFQAPKVTNNMPVNSMAWNLSNNDMVAVGYGSTSGGGGGKGAVLIWMVENIFYPERILHTSSPVTSLAFSRGIPSLLAVGCYDGSVLMFDLRQDQNTPVLDSGDTRHHDPVWDLRWVERGSDRVSGGVLGGSEVLTSVSTDGRVLMWDIKKGLSVRAELMRLRRVEADNAQTVAGLSGQSKQAVLVGRQAGAFCIDFNNTDNNIYLVGTEDGVIHKCSTSYNEQYLDSFRAHTGPVYKVKWSPYQAGVFISCSADWTVRVWWDNHLLTNHNNHNNNNNLSNTMTSSFNNTNTTTTIPHNSTTNSTTTSPSKPTTPTYTNANSTAAVAGAARDVNFLTIESENSAFEDVSWSNFNSTMFASTTSKTVQLWDLAYSTLDPYVSHELEAKATSVLFSPNCPALLAGDATGTVYVFRLLYLVPPATYDQQKALQKALSPDLLQTETK